MNHIPGPWEVVSDQDRSGEWAVKCGGYWIAELVGFGEIGEPQALANARLVATAPTLLEAVHAAHELLFHYDLARQENGVDWGPVEELRQKAIDQLWGAITAAQPSLLTRAGAGEG